MLTSIRRSSTFTGSLQIKDFDLHLRSSGQRSVSVTRALG